MKPEQIIDELVRDLTKVGSIPKSEVKRRIKELIGREWDDCLAISKQELWQEAFEARWYSRLAFPGVDMPKLVEEIKKIMKNI